MLRATSRARVRNELRTRLAFRFADLPMAAREAQGRQDTLRQCSLRLVLLGTPRLELAESAVALERLMAVLLEYGREFGTWDSYDLAQPSRLLHLNVKY